MPTLRVSLFGKTSIEYERPFHSNLPAKAMELLCFLLLNRKKSFRRELLATHLWENVTTAKGKKYLRDALWRLQSECESQLGLKLDSLLIMENDWVYVHPEADIWVDAHELEEAYYAIVKNPDDTATTFERLATAVLLYEGDLLEGWYQNWCVFERERLQLIYLQSLDRLMLSFEQNGRYDEGAYFGRLALKYDWARERTHRRLMRLYYLAGDRTAALRQFQSCKTMLKKEFQVEPERKTGDLYEMIRQGNQIHRVRSQTHTRSNLAEQNVLLSHFLDELSALRILISQIQNSLDAG